MDRFRFAVARDEGNAKANPNKAAERKIFPAYSRVVDLFSSESVSEKQKFRGCVCCFGDMAPAEAEKVCLNNNFESGLEALWVEAQSN